MTRALDARAGRSLAICAPGFMPTVIEDATTVPLTQYGLADLTPAAAQWLASLPPMPPGSPASCRPNVPSANAPPRR